MDDHVSSLLEVGTGFHPELTGRENVYLNGTILGMTKRGDRPEVRTDRRVLRRGALPGHAGEAVQLGHEGPPGVRGGGAPGAGDPDRRRGPGRRRRGVPVQMPRQDAGRDHRGGAGPSCSSATTCRACGSSARGRSGSATVASSATARRTKSSTPTWPPRASRPRARPISIGSSATAIAARTSASSGARCSTAAGNRRGSSASANRSPWRSGPRPPGTSTSSTPPSASMPGGGARIVTATSEDLDRFYTCGPAHPFFARVRLHDLHLNVGEYDVTIALRSGRSILDSLDHCLHFQVIDSPHGDRKLPSRLGGFIRFPAEWQGVALRAPERSRA